MGMVVRINGFGSRQLLLSRRVFHWMIVAELSDKIDVALLSGR